MQCSIYSHWNTWMKIMIVEKNYLWLCIFLWMQSSQCFRYNKEKSETYLKLSVLFSISCIADFLANHYGTSKFWNLSLKGTPFPVSWGTSAFLDPYVRETPFSPSPREEPPRSWILMQGRLRSPPTSWGTSVFLAPFPPSSSGTCMHRNRSMRRWDFVQPIQEPSKPF